MPMLCNQDAGVIEVPIYGQYVILLSSREQIEDFVILNGLEDTFKGARAHAYQYSTDTGDACFVLAGGDWDLGLLMHECIHITHFILTHAGIPISRDNTEVEAYLAQHIFQEAYNILYEPEEYEEEYDGD